MKTNSNKNILVIDDERDMVSTLKLRLEASDGWKVVVAYDGQEGMEKVRQERPDLILLDVVMPKMNGYQVCRELKEAAETKSIPIILLTAKAQESDKFWGQETGADVYITKPFKFDDLIEKIKGLLNNSHHREMTP